MYKGREVSNQVLNHLSNSVRKEIGDILHSGDYYVTHELANNFMNINDTINKLKLQNNLLNSSDRFNPQRQDSKGVVAKIQAAQNYLAEFKQLMHQNALRDKQENEIRELHQWGLNNLRGIQDSMAEVSFNASDRIRQFGDHVGVTDRYTGYRNNLTRGSVQTPVIRTNWGFLNDRNCLTDTRPWSALENPRNSFLQGGNYSDALRSRITLGSSLPATTDHRGYKTISSLFPRTNSMYVDPAGPGSPGLDRLLAAGDKAIAANETYQTMAKPATFQTLSVQEQAGIVTKYPGRTEYMHKYPCPPMDIPTSHFNINPEPNFKLHGRPLDTTKIYPSITEYQSRYEFPDSNKIVRMPWLRK